MKESYIGFIILNNNILFINEKANIIRHRIIQNALQV
jgi:hypothetical protein